MRRTPVALLLVLLVLALAGARTLRAQDASKPDEAARAAALEANEEGVKLAEKGELEAALAKFAEALERTPDDPTIKANSANVHAAIGKKLLDDRKFPEAAKEFHTSAVLVPTELEYPHAEGIALARAGEDRDAVAIFERVVKEKPDRVATLVALGQSLYRLGRNKDAIARWEQALKLSPDDKDLAKALEKAKKEESVEGGLQEDLGAPHFTIKFDGEGDRTLARRVGGVLEDAYRDVGYALGRYPEGEIAVVIYPKKAFRAVTGTHGWVAALYDGKIRVPAEGLERAPASEVKRVLTHEYTHALIKSIAGSSVPAWLHEGIAQLEEGRTRADARLVLAGKQLPALSDLTGAFISDPDAGRVTVRYASAFDFVASLAERRGMTAIADLLGRMGKGEKLEDAATAVFGSSVEELYSDWQQSLVR
jgi:tetratricopeptide (TPR) repeat protein